MINIIDKAPIILVSNANADDIENVNVVNKHGFLRNLNPINMFIIVNVKKYISCEL